ncbi:MAG: hypothetical protein D6776_10970 [Planctomycetota bacterium]|nr:MAG: hypothetical protein D6776_10970 [Planctomycetota bacterium]
MCDVYTVELERPAQPARRWRVQAWFREIPAAQDTAERVRLELRRLRAEDALAHLLSGWVASASDGVPEQAERVRRSVAAALWREDSERLGAALRAALAPLEPLSGEHPAVRALRDWERAGTPRARVRRLLAALLPGEGDTLSLAAPGLADVFAEWLRTQVAVAASAARDETEAWREGWGIAETSSGWDAFLAAVRNVLLLRARHEAAPRLFTYEYGPEHLASDWRRLFELGFALWVEIVRERAPALRFSPRYARLEQGCTLLAARAFAQPRPQRATIEAQVRAAAAVDPAPLERIVRHVERHRVWLNGRVHGRGAGSWTDGDLQRLERVLPLVVARPLRPDAPCIANDFVAIARRLEVGERPGC